MVNPEAASTALATCRCGGTSFSRLKPMTQWPIRMPSTGSIVWWRTCAPFKSRSNIMGRKHIDRRVFLRNATLASLSLTGGGAVAGAVGSQPRALSLIHTHTGERLTETYFDANGYVPEAL